MTLMLLTSCAVLLAVFLEASLIYVLYLETSVLSGTISMLSNYYLSCIISYLLIILLLFLCTNLHLLLNLVPKFDHCDFCPELKKRLKPRDIRKNLSVATKKTLKRSD